jgi:rubredoxin
MGKKKTIEDCHKLAKSRGGEFLSAYYRDNKTKYIWKCEYGHIWPSTYANIKKDHWCPECHRDSRRNTLRDCILLANKYEGKFLSTEYTKNKIKYIWQCKYGHTFLARYNDVDQGHWCPVCSIEKTKETMKKKYGVEHVLQSREIKEKQEKTMELRFGVRHPQQHPDLAIKSAKASNITHILRHWFSREEIVCQGSYEKATVEYFNRNHIDYLWQPKIFTMPNGKTYRPDCYLPDQDLWIEIKGYFRKDAQEKWQWFQSEYPNSELWDKQKLRSLKIL